MGPDVGMQGYKWAGDPVGITPGEAEAFHLIAQNVASHMTYDLLEQELFFSCGGRARGFDEEARAG